jgi:hypothetical protein
MPQATNHGALQILTIGVSTGRKIQRKKKGTAYCKGYGILRLRVLMFDKAELTPELQR